MYSRISVLPLLAMWMAFVFVSSSSVAQSPSVTGVSPVATSVPQYDKFEATIFFSGSYGNAYDYDDIVIKGIFTAPSGRKDTIEGFYMQDFTLNTGTGNVTPGNGNFKIRYAPSETGAYNYMVTISNQFGYTESNNYAFTSTQPVAKGFVRKNNTRYLGFDNGDQYVMIGQNLAWQQNNKYLNFKNWTDKLAASKANFIRLWQCSWGLGIEWRGSPYDGLKRYRQDNAFYTDQLLEECRAKDIFMMLCINHHGMVSTTVDPNWNDNPYNAVNGGPCAKTWDFFTNATARSLHKNRLRYIVARWGYSRNIMSWELFNEVEWTDNFSTNQTQIKDWHQEMARFLREKDPFDHLVTTSFAKDNNDPATWNLPEMDFTQTHYYNGSANVESVLVSGVQSYLSAYQKPTYTGEFGINTSGGGLVSTDPNGIYIHNSVWATLFSGGMGGGASWWWDNYIEPQNLYVHYAGPGAMTDRIRFRAHNYQPVAAATSGGGNADLIFSPAGGWGATTAANLTVNADGSLSPGTNMLGTYLYGSVWNTQYRNPPTFTVNYPVNGQFRVITAGGTGTNPKINIYVDGNLVLDQNAAANTTYSVNITAGNHAIKVDNLGIDWVQISQYVFTNIGSPLNAYVLRSADNLRAAGWLHNKNYNWQYVGASGTPPAVNGATLQLSGLGNGAYEVRWYNCLDGSLQSTVNATSNAGLLTVAIPVVNWDVAFTAFAASTLPVRRMLLNGAAQPTGNRLDMLIEGATDVRSVEVERSSDGQTFATLGNLQRIGSGYNGSQSWYDNKPLQALHFYRLKATDADGAFTYSRVVTLQRQSGTVMTLYPNPASTQLQVKASGDFKNTTLRITNLAGAIMLRKAAVPADGKLNEVLNIGSLAPGTYQCALAGDDGKIIQVQSFVKQ